MNEDVFGFSSFGLVFLVGVGAVLLIVMAVVRYIVGLVPLTRARRTAVERSKPVVAAIVAVGYLLFAVRVIFTHDPDYAAAASLLLLMGLIVVAWSSLRDAIGGVVLRAGQALRVGDQVRIGDVSGRVQRLGYRVVTIETGEGAEAIIPYSQVSKASLLRVPDAGTGALHVFRVRLPPGLALADGKGLIRESAMRCHWASLVRDPKIEAADDGTQEVTVFALDPDHAPEVEVAVRTAIGKWQNTGTRDRRRR